MMQSFQRDGLKVSCEVAGSGPVLICVHGGGGIAQAWRQVAKYLQDSFTVVCPNMVGVGDSSGLPDGAAPDMSFEIRMLEAVAKQFGEPVYLAGHSYGGNIVLSTALAKTIDIVGVAAIEAVPLQLLRQAGQAGYADDLEAIVRPYITEGVVGKEREAALNIINYMSSAAPKAMLPAALDFAASTMVHNIQAWRTMFAQQEALQDYRGLGCPVLLMTAENGAPPAVASAPLLEELLPNPLRIEIADSEHLLIATHASEVAGYISTHVADCFAKRGSLPA